MGAVDLVIQVESPKSVARGLQRIGRAGHELGAVSKGRIFPKFRADLLEAAVVAKRMGEGAIEETVIPRNPLDVLAQQIVAICADEEIEIEINGEYCKDLIEILDRLDFRESAIVRKERMVYRIHNLEICLDDVEGLGRFIEVETLKENTMDAKDVFDFMEKLGVSRDEFITKSYLELLMRDV